MNIYKYFKHPEILNGYDDAIFHVPELAYEAIQKYGDIEPRWVRAVATDAKLSCFYAYLIIKARFPQGEHAISKDAHQSAWYASHVVHGRFEAGEKAISKDANSSASYALKALKTRFPEGEKTIIKYVEDGYDSEDPLIYYDKYLSDF